ncbi:transposase [Glaciecola sp. 1036]|uniref:transposase n=1 Tax=Alteromonadaceae TaxID=72275 RepID=UPI003CFC08CA
MTVARKHLINPEITEYYHCFTRCVRRAFLCGIDGLTGNSYEHRKEWIEERIEFLISIFCIQICTYAIMSNHYHLVLKISQQDGAVLSDQDVILRWGKLYRLPGIVELALLSPQKGLNKLIISQFAKKYRARLLNISWFMKALNEFISKKANKEDDCTGRFWEGRFKSQALLSEEAIIECMKYVDLNPFRADITDNIRRFKHTGFGLRLNKASNIKNFVSFEDVLNNTSQLKITFEDYSEMLLKEVDEWSKKLQDYSPKSGFVLQKNKLTEAFSSAIGDSESLKMWAQKLGKRWIKGISASETLFRYSPPKRSASSL